MRFSCVMPCALHKEIITSTHSNNSWLTGCTGNLYAQESSGAPVRAMTDDGLVDSCSQENLGLVQKIADRKNIAIRVVDFYGSLIK